MGVKFFVAVLLAALASPAAAWASGAPACNRDAVTCSMPCCTHDQPVDAIAVLLSLGNGVTTADELFPPAARQRAVVWFHRPVWVGRKVLMGKYIIEHDTDRQARGEPCTYLYAADKLETPVVTFHCEHLHAAKSDRAVVGLQSTGDSAQKLLWFQFAGEDAAHGYPAR
jgi:hypothetical protein